MDELPTLLIREPDDDGTLIDPKRLRDPCPPLSPGQPSSLLDALKVWAKEGWRRLPAGVAGPGGGMIGTSLILALALGVGLLAYQQWRVADALREAIVAMKTRPPTRSSEDINPSVDGASANVANEPLLDVSTNQVDISDRDELELRGATLVGANNFVSALAHYEMLAERFPAESAFGDVISALRAKVRCVNPGGPSSDICP